MKGKGRCYIKEEGGKKEQGGQADQDEDGSTTQRIKNKRREYTTLNCRPCLSSFSFSSKTATLQSNILQKKIK